MEETIFQFKVIFLHNFANVDLEQNTFDFTDMREIGYLNRIYNPHTSLLRQIQEVIIKKTNQQFSPLINFEMIKDQ